jgi:hypothetical protein
MRFHLLVAALLLPLTGCGDELVGPKVVISNGSGHALSNLTLTGSGFVTSIGRLNAGSVESATLHPIGESSLRVTFDVDGRHVDSGEHGYFENSVLYKLAVDVDRDLKVSITVDLKG